MLSLSDANDRLVLSDRGSTRTRVGCGCVVVVLSVLLVVMLAMALLPPHRVSMECDRGRGTCAIEDRTIPLPQLERAAAVRDHRGGGRGSYYMPTVDFELVLAGGDHHAVCSAPADDEAARDLERAVAQVNAFIATPATSTLRIHCDEESMTTAERVWYPVSVAIPLAIVLFFIYALRGRRRVEVDGPGRTIKVRGKLGSGVAEIDLSFDEIAGVEIDGDVLRLVRRSGPHVAIAAASNASEREILARASSRIEALLGTR